MSDYTQGVDFSAKDALASGDPNKQVLGADVDAELALISTAIASKLDNPSTDSAKAAIALPSVVAFSATAASDQGSVTTGTGVKMLFATEVYDYGSDFSSSTFTAPATGQYLFTATVQTLTTITDGLSCQAYFVKNGSATMAASRETTGVGNTVIINLSWLGQLTSGDTVETHFRHNLGSDVTMDAASSFATMHFSGARLS
jgi:hypothetical protein